jgi:CRP/FNR family cyclic AMP-dependent transcriptional regulator
MGQTTLSAVFEYFSWIEAAGWIAAALTLLAYSMRTMVVLRMVALFANVFFIIYGYMAEVYPALALHSALIVLNATRLLQIRRDIKLAKSRKNVSDLATGLAPFMKEENFKKGQLLFAKGDRPDKVYLIAQGQVRLAEIDKQLVAGEIFGEIGFFTDTNERTLSAICETDCRLMSADEEAFTKAYYQSPALGMALLKLVATRLSELSNINTDGHRL